jgi:hypothetical protein
MSGLASKSTTTWFLAGRDPVEFIKFHFEAANTVKLTYTVSATTNHGLAWSINTAYIMAAPRSAIIC